MITYTATRVDTCEDVEARMTPEEYTDLFDLFLGEDQKRILEILVPEEETNLEEVVDDIIGTLLDSPYFYGLVSSYFERYGYSLTRKERH